MPSRRFFGAVQTDASGHVIVVPTLRTGATMAAGADASAPGTGAGVRCVYCKRRLSDRFVVVAHEADCDMRAPMLRIWKRTRERALWREERR